MKKYKRKDWCLMGGAFLLLGLSYWLCRYVLFDLHGMKQWPDILALLSFVVLQVSFFMKKLRLMVAAPLGYIGGFGIALLFRSYGADAGGGRTSDFWLIWAVILLFCILAGVAAEIFAKKKS